MTATGYTNAVTALLSQVSDADRDGDLWLVAAYSSYSLGLVYDAGNAADRAVAVGLSSADKAALADYVSATARFAQGYFDADELARRLDRIEKDYPTSISGLYSKLDRLQREAVKGDPQVVASIAEVAAEVRGRGASFENMSIQADTLELQARYFVLNRQYIEEVAAFRMTEALGLDKVFLPARVENAKKIVAEMGSIFKGFEDVVERARALPDSRLVAEGLYTFEMCKLQDHMVLDKVAPSDPKLEKRRAELLAQSIKRVEFAATLFEDARMPDASLRCHMLRVDLLWMADRKQEALNVAASVAKVAAALGLGGIAARAADVLAGNSPLAEWDRIPKMGS